MPGNEEEIVDAFLNKDYSALSPKDRERAERFSLMRGDGLDQVRSKRITQNINRRLASRKRRPVIFSGAAAAMVLLFVGAYLLLRPATEQVVLQGAAGEGISAIDERPFTSKGASVTAAKIGEQLNLKFREMKSLSAKLKNRELTLKYNTGMVIVAFSPSKKIKRLRIITGGVTFAIVGTEFMISSGKSATRLITRSGVVKVAHAGKTVESKPNSLWTNGLKQPIPLKKGSVKKLFKEFSNSDQKSKAVESLLVKEERNIEKQVATRRAAPEALLVLKDGSKMKGHIVRQDEHSIDLDDGTDIIKIEKKDIVRRAIVPKPE